MEDKQLTTIVLDREIHNWVRAFAFNNKISMATAIRRAVEQFREKVEKEQ